MAFIRRAKQKVPASTEVYYDGEIFDDGSVRVRKATIGKDENGKNISKKYHSHVIFPGDNYSNEPKEVRDVCDQEHTPEKVIARAAFVAAQQ